MPPLETTPVTAAHVVAALDLSARLEKAVDSGDGAALAALFTDDGHVTGLMQASWSELADLSRKDRAGPPMAHLIANHLVSAYGPDTLQVEYMLVVLGLDDEAPRIVRVNRITDDIVNTPNGWRVRRHDVAEFHGVGGGSA